MSNIEIESDFKKPEGYKNINFSALTEKNISNQKK